MSVTDSAHAHDRPGTRARIPSNPAADAAAARYARAVAGGVADVRGIAIAIPICITVRANGRAGCREFAAGTIADRHSRE